MENPEHRPVGQGVQVSRGKNPPLAGECLPNLLPPVLLIEIADFYTSSQRPLGKRSNQETQHGPGLRQNDWRNPRGAHLWSLGGSGGVKTAPSPATTALAVRL